MKTKKFISRSDYHLGIRFDKRRVRLLLLDEPDRERARMGEYWGTSRLRSRSRSRSASFLSFRFLYSLIPIAAAPVAIPAPAISLTRLRLLCRSSSELDESRRLLLRDRVAPYAAPAPAPANAGSYGS